MDLTGLSGVETPDELITWLNDHMVTPVRPSASGSDLAAILKKIAGIYSNTKTIDKTADDITGTDPNYIIDLSEESIVPLFPAIVQVYISIDGDDDHFEPLSPVIYRPSNKTIEGMNSPTDFPSQKIKIIII